MRSVLMQSHAIFASDEFVGLQAVFAQNVALPWRKRRAAPWQGTVCSAVGYFFTVTLKLSSAAFFSLPVRVIV